MSDTDYHVGCIVCHRFFSTDNRPLKLCSKCKNAVYCSTEHQKEDWKKHKLICNKNCTKTGQEGNNRKGSQSKTTPGLNQDFFDLLTRFWRKYSRGQYEQALLSIKKAITHSENWILREPIDPSVAATAVDERCTTGNLYAAVLLKLGRYDEARQEGEALKELAGYKNDIEGIMFAQAQVSNIEGEIQIELGEYRKAVTLLTQAADSFEKLMEQNYCVAAIYSIFEKSLGSLRMCYARLYSQQSSQYLQTSKRLLQMVINHGKVMEHSDFSKAQYQYRYAIALYSNKKHEEAAKYYKKAAKFYRKLRDWRNLFIALISAAEAHRMTMGDICGNCRLCMCKKHIGGKVLKRAKQVKDCVTEAVKVVSDHPDLLDGSGRVGFAFSQKDLISRIDTLYSITIDKNAPCCQPKCEGALFRDFATRSIPPGVQRKLVKMIEQNVNTCDMICIFARHSQTTNALAPQDILDVYLNLGRDHCFTHHVLEHISGSIIIDRR